MNTLIVLILLIVFGGFGGVWLYNFAGYEAIYGIIITLLAGIFIQLTFIHRDISKGD